MAKQSGLHQIRGKVGEHSYYKQTGVSGGLIRSINQGLSSRVKTGEEYANTRLNMQEFGQACQIAGQLGRLVSPKFRPMVLPFSQSKMAKDILALIKADTTAPVMWGWRGLMPSKFADALASLNETAKFPFDTLCSRVALTSQTASLSHEQWEGEFFAQAGNTDFLDSIGADGVVLKGIFITATYTAPNYSTGVKGSLSVRVWASENTTDPFHDTDSAAVSSSAIVVPANPDDNFHRVFVGLIMPFRTIGGTKHILQEYCTFKAFEVPEPTE